MYPSPYRETPPKRRRGALAVLGVSVVVILGAARFATAGAAGIPGLNRIQSLAGEASTAPSTAIPLPPAPSPRGGQAPVPPDGSALFGVHLDWAAYPPSAYTARSGIRPAQVGEFVPYPLTTDGKTELRRHARLAEAARFSLFLTFEPTKPLPDLSADDAGDAAALLGEFNALGVPVYVRFAHEMNAGWYPWGQQPGAYVAAFRRFADLVHRTAPQTSIVWSPNYGGGYPFDGGHWNVKPGTPDYLLMDTDHDGRITMADDPYLPFYPGDEYVDWVGLTDYFFGLEWPWGENEVPERQRFVRQMDGDFAGRNRDERPLTSFYEEFAVGHRKPMAISETGALWNSSRKDGATEFAIKSAWMAQVLSPALRTRYPELKMINWFEFRKSEQEGYGLVDWRATANPAVRAQFVKAVTAPTAHFVQAPGPAGG